MLCIQVSEWFGIDRVRKEMVAQDKKQEEQIEEIKGTFMSDQSHIITDLTTFWYKALLQQALHHEILEHLRTISMFPPVSQLVDVEIAQTLVELNRASSTKLTSLSRSKLLNSCQLISHKSTKMSCCCTGNS